MIARQSYAHDSCGVEFMQRLKQRLGSLSGGSSISQCQLLSLQHLINAAVRILRGAERLHKNAQFDGYCAEGEGLFR